MWIHYATDYGVLDELQSPADGGEYADGCSTSQVRAAATNMIVLRAQDRDPLDYATVVGDHGMVSAPQLNVSHDTSVQCTRTCMSVKKTIGCNYCLL